MKLLKKIWKFTKRLVVALLLIFLIVWGLIQIPAVQNYLVRTITNSLSNQLQTQVSVGRVNLRFFKTVVLEDIFIADQQQDTLLSAEKLGVNIALFSFFRKELNVNTIELQGARVKLYTRADSDTLNLQYLLDAFTSEEKTPKTSATPWDIHLDRVELNNTHVSYEQAGLINFHCTVPNLELQMNKLDLAQNRIDLEHLSIGGGDFQMLLYDQEKEEDTLTAPLPLPGDEPASFPDFPLAILANKIALKDNRVLIDFPDRPKQADGLDYNHLDFQNIDLVVNQLSWQEGAIQAEINDMSFQEGSGLEFKHLSSGLELNHEMIAARELRLEMPQSKIYNTSILRFGHFSDLSEFEQKVDLKSQFKDSFIALKEIKSILGSQYWPEFLKTSHNVQLKGALQLVNDHLSVPNFQLKISNLLQLAFSGQISDLKKEKMAKVTLQNFTTSYSALVSLGLPVPAFLSSLGTVQLSTTLEGPLQAIRANKLKFRTQSATFLDADLFVKGLPKIQQTVFQADIHQLVLDTSLLKALVGSASEALVDSLGTIQYAGELDGSLDRFHLKGQLVADCGLINSDINLGFTENYEDASYQGTLSFPNLNLGKIAPSFPALAQGQVQIDGWGIKPETMNNQWQIRLDTLLFKDYEYQNIQLNGNLKEEQFTLEAQVNDPHLNTQLRAEALLWDSLPKLRLSAQVEEIDFYTLQLIPYPLVWNGLLEVDIQGIQLDDLRGNIRMMDWQLANDSSAVQSDSLILTSTYSDGKRKITLASDFFSSFLEGDFQITDITQQAAQFIDHFIPVSELIESDEEETIDSTLHSKYFSFAIETGDCSALSRIVHPDFKRWEPAKISGQFNNKEKRLEINARLAGIGWKQIGLDSLQFEISSNQKRLEADLAVKNISLGATRLPGPDLQADIQNKNLNFTFEVNEDQSNLISIGGNLQSDEDQLVLHFAEEMIVRDSLWAIHPDNQFVYQKGIFKISDFSIKKGIQALHLRTLLPKIAGSQPPLEIELDDLQLDAFPNITDYTGYALKGMANAKIRIDGLPERPIFEGDIRILDLVIGKQRIGQFFVNAQQETEQQRIAFSLELEGANELSTYGFYDYRDNVLEADIELTELSAALANIFVGEQLSNTQGQVFGQLKLSGSPAEPVLTGSLNTKDLSTVLKITGTHLNLPASRIDFKRNQINFGTFNLLDKAGRIAQVSGMINHHNFRNITLNMSLASEEFLVLNKAYQEGELFYGTLLVKTTAGISGPLDRMQIEVNARSLPGSTLTFLPSTNEELQTGNQYIIFGHPDSLMKAGQIDLRTEFSNPYNFDLKAALDITPDTKLAIVFDPSTEDEITCTGQASLALDMEANGNLRVVGDYVFEHGKYNFNFEGLVKREFEIQRGSFLSFSGNPYQATFDLTAVYQTKTSTYALIGEQAVLNDQERKQASKLTDVLVLLRIRGNLQDPQLSFEIQIPRMEEQGEMGNAISRSLTKLNQNPDQLNQQVFGLLFFNSFISGQSGGATASISQSIESAAFSSLRNFVSGQLNKLAGKYVKGFEISFNLDSYSSGDIQGSSTLVSEFGVSISKELFNERLSIQVGSNFNFTRDQLTNWSNSSFSTVGENYVIEYKLNEKGSYLVRLFHRNDLDIIQSDNNYRTGLSFVVRKDLKNKKKKRRTEEDGRKKRGEK